jgi:HAD superfamily 5'-nucleotidase-like hydrolase
VAAEVDPHDAAIARALSLELSSAHVVKLDANRRVRVARRGRVWLEHDELALAHPNPVSEHDVDVHPLSSRFDVPTMWLFEAVVAARGCDPRDNFDPARICRDVREMLDWSHTRGDLKHRLVADLARFVSPVEHTTERLLDWRRAGKQLFVVTNSDRAFAEAVLDLSVGTRWRELFAVVSMSSAKPRFFDRNAPAHASTSRAASGATVLEGAHATTIEHLLNVRGERVLYVGDNARADVRAARSYGWKTVHVVAELSTPVSPDQRWGATFGTESEPSWFAHDVLTQADVVCDRVDRLLALEPDARIEPAAWSPLGGESP